MLEQLDQTGQALGGVFAGIQTHELDRPTPCADFTVQGVLVRMIGGAARLRGGLPRAGAPRVDGAARGAHQRGRPGAG
ncbi:MAG: hypothetical protein U5R31_09230 [Acidimicrobiia bacterium]|nr:hypothetical protein [Acidimicrobiia bacterium]